MILDCQNISKAFGTTEIIRQASFHIEEREKAAIVGINGAGKSTLLKIIIGEMKADSGEIVMTRGKTLGYLAQQQNISADTTIYEEMLDAKKELIQMEEQIRSLEKQMQYASGEELEQLMNTYHRLTTEFERQNGYAYRSEITGILKGLGFTEEEFSKKTGTLSGGQKTRVALGKLLLQKPDLILLDEPTNHLDMASIAWLETYLVNYPGAVLLVAHDRYFLNKIVTKVIDIELGEVSVYSGNYTQFSEKKAQIREAKIKAWYNQQREIKHQEEVIAKLKSFNREKSIRRAESREKMLDKLERVERPVEVDSQMNLSLTPRILSGSDVLTVFGLSKSYRQLLFSDLNFTLKRGEKTAIIGNNGTGKTTLLKIINGLVTADAGTVTLGSKVNIGYYDQEHQVLHSEKTIFQEISDAYPVLTNTEIRNVLASFLFTGDDVFKRIADLSGGERGRVSLAKLMLSEANFLILDEPTNHLDIESKEILEQALNRYTGTVLYVSHDRYFINQTATRILDLTGHTLVNYIGNYDYYLEKSEELTKIYASETAAAPTQQQSQPSAGKEDWKRAKEEQARERKRQNDLARTERRIQELEELDKELDAELAKEEIFTDVAKCMEVNQKKADVQTELEKLYEVWEELASGE